MNINQFHAFWIAAFLILGFASSACTTHTLLLSSQSTVSNAEALADLQAKIRKAENDDCDTITISSGVGVGLAAGVGIGFVIPDDCKDCDDMKGQQEKVIEKQERVYVVNAMLQC
ncbi:MAG: hypothetical protein JSU59_11200 [Nitrospirota bacterium]|nr:MAG: hypothetical protein JSU59_11200 [Nitrospirota bacterium]